MKKVIVLCTAAALCLSALSACGPKPAEEKQVDLAAFAQSVQEKHEFSSLEKADPPTRSSASLCWRTPTPA